MTAQHSFDRQIQSGLKTEKFVDFEAIASFNALVHKVANLEKKLAEQQDYTARLEGDYEHLISQLQRRRYSPNT